MHEPQRETPRSGVRRKQGAALRTFLRRGAGESPRKGSCAPPPRQRSLLVVATAGSDLLSAYRQSVFSESRDLRPHCIPDRPHPPSRAPHPNPPSFGSDLRGKGFGRQNGKSGAADERHGTLYGTFPDASDHLPVGQEGSGTNREETAGGTQNPKRRPMRRSFRIVAFHPAAGGGGDGTQGIRSLLRIGRLSSAALRPGPERSDMRNRGSHIAP